jgi:hypothetical protein
MPPTRARRARARLKPSHTQPHHTPATAPHTYPLSCPLQVATREAGLQAELDACHETIEVLAAQLEAPT